MDKYIDMHCHILPGVDDGAQDLDDTRDMLTIAYNEGIRTIVATPHHHDRRGKAPLKLLRKRLRDVETLIDDMGIDMKIYLGMEVYFGQDVLDELGAGMIATMGGSEFVLLEFSPGDEFSYIQRAVQKVQMKGYGVIIAHAERYACLSKNIDNIRYLVEMGAYIQVNASSITGGFTMKRFIRKLMQEGLVHLVGTDAHSQEARSPLMQKAAAYVEKKHGHDYMERIFWKNGNRILRNENI